MTTELATVIVSSIIGLSGVIITALLRLVPKNGIVEVKRECELKHRNIDRQFEDMNKKIDKLFDKIDELIKLRMNDLQLEAKNNERNKTKN